MNFSRRGFFAAIAALFSSKSLIGIPWTYTQAIQHDLAAKWPPPEVS